MAKIAELVNQKLEDFKEEVIARLERIEGKVDAANGKVATSATEIAILKMKSNSFVTKEYAETFANKKVKEAQENCPTRKAEETKETVKNGRDWGMFVAVGASSIIGSVLTVIILKVVGL